MHRTCPETPATRLFELLMLMSIFIAALYAGMFVADHPTITVSRSYDALVVGLLFLTLVVQALLTLLISRQRNAYARAIMILLGVMAIPKFVSDLGGFQNSTGDTLLFCAALLQIAALSLLAVSQDFKNGDRT